MLLRKSGAHLHADEIALAEIQARRRPAIWALAGLGGRSLKERQEAEMNMNRVHHDDDLDYSHDSGRGEHWGVQSMAGSAPA